MRPTLEFLVENSIAKGIDKKQNKIKLRNF